MTLPPSWCFTGVRSGADDQPAELGYVLSKGVNGVKKDMKEAAKWYRAALMAGSNTPGLAWVWKDKYNPDDVSSPLQATFLHKH
jgi:TPR repeat protein